MKNHITAVLTAAAVAFTGLSFSAVPAAAEINASSRTAVTLVDSEARLAAINNQVEQANAKLDALNRKLAADQAREAELSRQAAGLARMQYEAPMLSLGGLLSAHSLSDVLGDIAQARVIDAKQRSLLTQVRDMKAADQTNRDQAAVQLASLKDAQAQAAQVAADAKAANDAEVAARAELAARAAAIAASATTVVAQPMVSQAAAWTGQGPYPNHFAYGYCTWYVANKRYVPWFGNAIDWWPNARAYGYAEGQQPRVGAIMVTAESGYGHVAYVEQVNGDGSWVVSEMNFRGWNQVSTRTVRPGQTSVIGFIY